MQTNTLLQGFLSARALMDTAPAPAAAVNKKGPGQRIVEKPVPDNSAAHIIQTKPGKKVVMEYLRQRVAELLEEDD